MFTQQEEPVYSEAKIEDFTNILPFELELNLNDFTHFILSNSVSPADNPFDITRKQHIIKNYYDNIMLKVVHKNNLNKLKNKIDHLEEKSYDFEIQNCVYTNSVTCLGKELIDYLFTSLDGNLNFILPIIKTEMNNRIYELT